MLGAGAVAVRAAEQDAAATAQAEKAEKEKADKEKAEKEKADKEKADKEKADKEKAEKEKAEKEKAEKAEQGQPPDASQGIWDLLFQSRITELAAINESLNTLLKNLSASSRSLTSDLNGIEEDYRRLVTISSVSKGLPTEQTVVVEWLRRLEDRLGASMAPLEGTLNDLKSRLEEVSTLGEGTAQPGATEVTAELKDFLKNLNQTQDRLGSLQTRLNRVLTPARNLAAKIKNQREQLVASIPRLWQSYYLDRGGKLYEVGTWTKVSQGFVVLKETFALRMDSEMPQGGMAWLNVFLRALVFCAPLFALLVVTRRFARRRWPAPLRDGWIRLSGHSLSWLCLGLTFHFAAWTPSGGTYHLLSVAGTLLMSIGQMALAWDLYTFDRADLQRSSPLWPLFAPLLAGLLLLFMNLPGGLLGGLWIAVLGLSLWTSHKRTPPDIPFPLVLNLLRGQTAILWVAVVMTMLGWGRLSILVCMAYAALAVCVQQAVGFMRLTNLVSEHLPQEGFQALLSGMLLALLLPAVLVVSTLATGLWILAYPGGAYLLTHLANLDFSIGKTTFSTIQILFILSAFYVTRSFISVGRSFISELPRQGFRSDITGPIQVAFTYALWGLFGLYTLSALGFSLTSLAVVAGGLSVGIGFGLQNIINNFISGLLIIFGQTLREGDIIEVGNNLTGTVKRINVRSTMVETPDNAIIFVPNAEFLSGRLTNWTRNGRMVRRSISVGVAYGTDVELVIRLLREVADKHPRVLAYPSPMVIFTDFASSSLNFELRFWIADIVHGLDVTTDLRVAIKRVFAENGVEMPFPQMDVHLRDGADGNKDEASPAQGDSAANGKADARKGVAEIPATDGKEGGHDKS